jgi:predicted small lipoprotein YifL
MITKISAILLVSLALTACGQSGPLYVPGDPSTVEQPTEPASDEDNNKRREDDED